MKKILAIGGAVIKTSREELKSVILQNKVKMLIHNGGSIFHDFQLSIDNRLGGISYPLENLVKDYTCNEKASNLIWKWINEEEKAPEESVTHLCEKYNIPVLLFTGLGCDFWQLFNDNWEIFARKTKEDFGKLCEEFQQEFHYTLMGSAVIHPEVFTKALAKTKPTQFRADVVDFLNMYRPRTRVSKYGIYYLMSHKKFLNLWLKGKLYFTNHKVQEIS